jgi:hypothetical protein
MILLNSVIQAGAAPDRYIPPLWIFPAQEPQRLMSQGVPIKRDFARPPRQADGQYFTMETLCRRNASTEYPQDSPRSSRWNSCGELRISPLMGDV